MNKNEFLVEFADVLQTEKKLKYDTELNDIEEWDSLSKMATSAFLDKNFGAKVTFADFENIKTVADIAKKAGI